MGRQHGLGTLTVLMLSLWLVSACGGVEDDTALLTPPEPMGGKADSLGGSPAEAPFTALVEANLPLAAVKHLAIALQQDWVEEHKSHWYSSSVEEEEVEHVFGVDADLAREFSDLLHDGRQLRKVYQALREIVHNGAAIQAFRQDLEQRRYRTVYEAYVPFRPALLDQLGDVVRTELPAGALPSVIINIPAERLVVFHDGVKIHDTPVVVGRPEYEGYDQNSKTRVGDHAISEWVHCYSNAEYPSWCDEPMSGAFGKWTAKLDRSYQFIHGTVGSGLIDWFAIATASGSHGCVRNQNSDIERLHDLAPEGSGVRKIYVVTERTAQVIRLDREEDRNSHMHETDLFNQDRAVRFWVKNTTTSTATTSSTRRPPCPRTSGSRIAPTGCSTRTPASWWATRTR